MPDIEESERRLVETIDRAIGLLNKFIIPIFGNDRWGKPEQIGTGFIVKTGLGYLLVSAAHVIRQTPSRELFYYVEPNKIRKVTGRRILGQHPTGQEDQLDVGGVLLSDEYLPPYPAVEKFPVDQAYLCPAYLPRVGKEYVVIGFPASRSKRNPNDKSVRLKPYAYHSPTASEDVYSACGLHPDTHLILPFDKKHGFDSAGRHINLPKPQGMSGAPFWVLYEDAAGRDNKIFPLVAVATFYCCSHKAMIATDCRVVVDMINTLV